ncbi:serine hydrolase domain-containing protein [Streptomyces lycii]|uniref:Beta-lactamase family protein n=2 Tax=Streptomyces TaxID=1883 RepID=A0ABQ7FCE2_9ACTN|nr:serine hydrolase domain-containing protein [Streptomyces lycii]KAF4406756.1 beta-lactamase family protein [Streptomyces lycii]
MRRTFVTLTAITAALGIAAGATATAADRSPGDAGRDAGPVSRATLQHDADALLDLGAPGVLVALDTPGRDITVRSGYGNVDRKTPVPWNARFRIGSYTKTFVAATVLHLAGEGKLSLDDTVEDWLPGLVRGHGHDADAITVRMLLQHTSGLPDYVAGLPHLFLEEEFEARRFETVTAGEAVRTGLRLDPEDQDTSPGEWSYSNTNYALIGMIIERAAGHSWQHEVRERIIEPLGLRHTYAPDTFPFIPGPHAVGYQRFAEKGLEADPEDPRYGEAVDVTVQNPSWGGAAGEMISTAEDANRFLRALLGGEVLRPAELAEMKKTVRADKFDGPWPGARYGLGLMWVPNSCGGSWSHGGDIPGYKTRNGVTPDGSRSVVVSLNTDSMVPKPGVTAPAGDEAADLIDHALCGTG